MKILEFKNVDLIYQTVEAEVKALNNVNFTINEGEFVAIVGPSGCGKTTILSLASGLFPATNGRIILEDKNVTEQNNLTGYMFQNDHLFEWLTIWKNVMLGPEIQKKHKNKEVISKMQNLLDKYGLKDFKNNYPKQLSGGMRQRVALLRTLALDPKLLLLDEPFSALDFQTRLQVCDDVYSIIKSEKKTAILVTHDISEAISMADKIFVLTKRPATIKKVFKLDFDKNLTPLQKRENPLFSQYFDKILKELTYEKVK